MENLNSSVAQRISQAAVAFQQQRTGHKPKSVAVVLSGDTLLITLHGALSQAEKALAQSPAGMPRCRSFTGSCSPTPPTSWAGDQTDYRGRSARSDYGSRNDDGHRRAGLHDRDHGAGVLARPGRACGQLERERTGLPVRKKGRFAMLVLSRKTQEAVVIGGADGFHRLFKVKVLEIRGANVKLGFEVDPDVPVHRARFGNVSSTQLGRKSSAKDRLDNTQATETTILAEPVAVGV